MIVARARRPYTGTRELTMVVIEELGGERMIRISSACDRDFSLYAEELSGDSADEPLEQVGDAPEGALFADNLRADLEEALDSALLRDQLAATPTLFGLVKTIAA